MENKMEESKINENLCKQMSKTNRELLKHNSELHKENNGLERELRECYDGNGEMEKFVCAMKEKRDDFYQKIEKRRAKNQKDLDDLVKRVELGQE